MAQAAQLIAEFTNGSKRADPKLTISELAFGRRIQRQTLVVKDKREARHTARLFGAQPWNF